MKSLESQSDWLLSSHGCWRLPLSALHFHLLSRPIAAYNPAAGARNRSGIRRFLHRLPCFNANGIGICSRSMPAVRTNSCKGDLRCHGNCAFWLLA